MEKRSATLWTYQHIESGQRFLQVMDGVELLTILVHVKKTSCAIRHPQNTVNWKDPEEWIPEETDR